MNIQSLKRGGASRKKIKAKHVGKKNYTYFFYIMTIIIKNKDLPPKIFWQLNQSGAECT